MLKSTLLLSLFVSIVSLNCNAMELQPVYHRGDRIEYFDQECDSYRYGVVIHKCKKHRIVLCGEDDPDFGCQHLECFNYPDDESFECRKTDLDDTEIYYLVVFDRGKSRCIPTSQLKRT